MSDAYDKIKRAWQLSIGTTLTAEDVDLLMADTAIRDAVLQTNKDESP